VSFAYGTLAPAVVSHVSLEIQPGQHIGIVGRSGSGKSTLAHLLLGLYRPTSGRIEFDDLDLTGLDAGSVRRQLGIVTQRPYLFVVLRPGEHRAVQPGAAARGGRRGGPDRLRAR